MSNPLTRFKILSSKSQTKSRLFWAVEHLRMQSDRFSAGGCPNFTEGVLNKIGIDNRFGNAYRILAEIALPAFCFAFRSVRLIACFAPTLHCLAASRL